MSRSPIRGRVFAAAACLAVCSLAAQPPANLGSVLSARIAAALQESGAPSVSVAAVDRHGLIYARAFGKANLASDREATAGTRYAVGSIGKQFTAAAILLLERRGKLSLDDKVSKYFPDLTEADRIAIRELLSHTSGYEDYTPQDYIIPDWEKPTTALDVLNRWAKKPLNHGGEVSGFLARNTVFPTRDAAITALSNEDGIDLIGPLSNRIAELLLLPREAKAQGEDRSAGQVREILKGLQKGELDRSLFTANANSYFGETARKDYRTSLSALGKLKSVTRAGQSLRGGMIHRSYRAQFEKKTVLLNIYVMPDGKYEQFPVMDQL